MKKKIVLLLLLLLCGCSNTTINYGKKNRNNLKAKITNFEYGNLYKLTDIFENNDVFFLDEYLDISNLGENEAEITYQKDENILTETFKYTVSDTTKPLIWMSSSYTITVGDTTNILDKVICADNYDKKPNCYIEGVYDANTEGSYPLNLVAIDSHGNREENRFTINVKKTISGGGSSSNNTAKTNISDVINKYKDENTLVGIDVSEYQGDINWKKVKESGVDFAMIRLGLGYDDVTRLDYKFLQNIKGALANNIKVGVYFYSFAVNDEQAKMYAEFVIDTIKDYDITLPVAYDWENFKRWNEFGLSMTDLRSASYTFQDEVKKAGYRPLQYGSKTYLNAFWKPLKYDAWLAIYTINMNPPIFDDNYVLWQLSNTGKVPGISGDVDIDLYYLNK